FSHSHLVSVAHYISNKVSGMIRPLQLDPHRQQCITVRLGEFVCDADMLGSHGYVYIAIYQGLSLLLSEGGESPNV
ncbi:type IV toxin-antitoxin system YeeU family antitoxin, partial [Yersinia rohdei]|uniref:type IV toxin-antitoxin system YeeU family antitoxin n=1 Tax=Yersinia rohdei TaxID=29485 RepID=UPI0025AA3FD2